MVNSLSKNTAKTIFNSKTNNRKIIPLNYLIIK